MPTRNVAHTRLLERVAHWTERLKVSPRQIRVQRMTRKWGSCSVTGTVTFARDLALREQGFQDFVIAHELLHLRVPNHSRMFKAFMTAHVPEWRRYDRERLKPGRGG